MAKFEVGHRKVGGRSIGTPNKRFAAAELILENYGLNPLEELAKISTDLSFDVNTRISALKELAQYCYPKRKAIDFNHSQTLSPISDMPDELLEKALLDGAIGVVKKMLLQNNDLSQEQKAPISLFLSSINYK